MQCLNLISTSSTIVQYPNTLRYSMYVYLIRTLIIELSTNEHSLSNRLNEHSLSNRLKIHLVCQISKYLYVMVASRVARCPVLDRTVRINQGKNEMSGVSGYFKQNKNLTWKMSGFSKIRINLYLKSIQTKSVTP